MRKPLPCAPYRGYGRVVPSFMVCSVESSFHVPTIRSRISDSVCPKTDEPQSKKANRMNMAFFMMNGCSKVKFEPFRDCYVSQVQCHNSAVRQKGITAAAAHVPG